MQGCRLSRDTSNGGGTCKLPATAGIDDSNRSDARKSWGRLQTRIASRSRDANNSRDVSKSNDASKSKDASKAGTPTAASTLATAGLTVSAEHSPYSDVLFRLLGYTFGILSEVPSAPLISRLFKKTHPKIFL
jgi:hypothetical protein